MRSFPLVAVAFAVILPIQPGVDARMIVNPINERCLGAFNNPFPAERVPAYLRCTAEQFDAYARQRQPLVDQLRQLESDTQRGKAHYQADCGQPGEAERFRQDAIARATALRNQLQEASGLMALVANQRTEDVRGAWNRRLIGGDLNTHLGMVNKINQDEYYRHARLAGAPNQANAIIQNMQAMRPRQCGGPPVAGVPPGNPVHPQATANQWYVWLKAGEYTCCRAPDGRMPQPAHWDWGSRIPADSKVIGGPFADERAARAWMCGHQVNIAQAHIHNWAIVNGTLVSNLPCANLANTRYK